MTKKIFGLFGSSGFAREIMPVVKQNLDADYKLYFVEPLVDKPSIHGIEVIAESDFFELEGEKYFNIAIADSKIRQKIAERCESKNISPLRLNALNAVDYGDNQIHSGAIMAAFTTVMADVKIGKFFHANIYSYVAHDCVIGDYVTFAPRVSCNGNIHIHDHAYIGTGAIIKQGTAEKPLVIGEGAVVGMGAVVTKDVPSYTTVVGNPAKPFEKK